jgi:16S rRNA (cytosine967-C5)-methyltransferase
MSGRRPPRPRHQVPAVPASPPDARRVAFDTLLRIDTEGAYANVLLPKVLDRSDLDPRDRSFVTELVYGTTRMQRACDWLIDRFVLRDLDPPVRAALRLGTYQLHFLGTPPHAAVDATVEVVPRKVRGFVNAVLRRIADAEPGWPNPAVRLSYPDWIVDRLTTDLGTDLAIAALGAMNDRAGATERADGYMQDLASQWVVELVEAVPGDRVADLCAAPGGKATALAALASCVVASDIGAGRVRLLAGNVARYAPDRAAPVGRAADLADAIEPTDPVALTDLTGPTPKSVAAATDDPTEAGPAGVPSSSISIVAADATRPPYRPGSFDRVLLDAPCSGLGALRRRADARWRIDQASVDRLAALQLRLVDAAVELVAPGGVLVYSVCTMTAAETTAIDDHVRTAHPAFDPLPPPGDPWRPLGRGAVLLPQTVGTDGMAIFRYRRPS